MLQKRLPGAFSKICMINTPRVNNGKKLIPSDVTRGVWAGGAGGGGGGLEPLPQNLGNLELLDSKRNLGKAVF